jgi:pimeloyl-ACP methyl ester carboxylesterase
MQLRDLFILVALGFSMIAIAKVPPNHFPVKQVGKYWVNVGKQGKLPVFLSDDWSKPNPNVTRALLMLHGRLRNADAYFKSAEVAQKAAGETGKATLLLVPQFLADVDVKAHALPKDTLRWTWEGWEGGDLSIDANHVSSFEALDAILAKLADRTLFPNLKEVVIAGHSGGGQVAQRYAIAGKGEQSLTKLGIGVRYVVANPSSYAYFGKDRPEAKIAASCPGYNKWKYGMDSRPAYLLTSSVSDLEKAYVAKHVIYLFGTKDTDPQQEAIDRSCMARSQGPNRYVRGHQYVNVMKNRNAGTPNHSMFDIEGVGHEADKIFTSACGLKALFDLGGCIPPQQTAETKQSLD